VTIYVEDATLWPFFVTFRSRRPAGTSTAKKFQSFRPIRIEFTFSLNSGITVVIGVSR